MDTLLSIHSILRWVIVVVAALAVIKFAVGWASNATFKGVDRGLASGFSGLMDLQVLLGLVYFIWNGMGGAGFPLYRILHMIVMVLAAVAAHIPSRLKALTDKLRFLYSMLIILGVLVLIYAGVALLPGGWSR
ncbi:MAG TPA: hypothetical protein VHM28_09420 [Anaerolineales bacterium]|jgi:uncharacterized membrane protein YphA (DoxX/SURF4 family)|nr:hypothetical protein [Anaerolineales bacterium]